MPWVIPDAFTSNTSATSSPWFAGVRSKKDKEIPTKGIAPRRSNNNLSSNRNSTCSVNTFGQSLDMPYLSASMSASIPVSSELYQLDSSNHAAGTSASHQSSLTRHKKTGSTFGFLQEVQRQQCDLDPFTSNPPVDTENKATHDRGAGVGVRGRSGAKINTGCIRDEKTSRTPKAPQTSLPGPSTHDPTMLENEICALRYQICQATTVLTHVVQTMSVPSPAALINVMQQHQQESSLQDRQRAMQGHQPHPNGCSCAILHAKDDGKFGTGRGIAFLAACYCPDPWEFQERVLRQIESMQKETQTLRQEMLEVERRATMSLRQEILEWERTRDKEWVELNERLQRSLLVGEIDDIKEGLDSGRLSGADSYFERRNGGTRSGSPLSMCIGVEDTKTQDSGVGMCKEKGKSTCQSEDEHSGQDVHPIDKPSIDGKAVGYQSTGR
ncbi:hypothetical protein B0O80DRAFT_498280 [Mortierella sp. GBAus27b]|nr:hypothetical protein B0O80DRAFT_498280 [Mortierella sp. GBAus27b]